MPGSRLCWGLTTSVMILATMMVAGSASADPIKLMSKEVRASGRVLAVQAIDMNGDGLQDLVVAHLEKDGELNARGRQIRKISIFQQQRGPRAWSRNPDHVITVPDDSSLFIAGDFSPAPGREVALLSYEGVVIKEVDGEGVPYAGERRIDTEDPGFFDFPADGGLFLWDLAPDLDGDGRPELLFPSKNGYTVFGNDAKSGLVVRGRIKVRSSERFGPPMETQFLNRFLTYFSRLPRVVAIDMNNDRRLDLVTYRSKGLSTYFQTKEGTFPEEPDRAVPLAIVQKAAKDSAKAGDDKKDGFSSVKLALRDLNDDRRVDLIATKTIGKVGVFESLRTQVLVFLAGPKGIQDTKPNRIINLKGITLFPEFADVNGDKDLDIVLSSLRMDMVTNVKRAILSSVSTTYTVYLFKGGSRVYSDEPDFERDVDVDLSLIEKQGQVRLSYFAGDYNGDGLKDMLTVNTREELKVVPATIESSFFSGKYLSIDDDNASTLAIPTSPQLLIQDLTGDRRDQIILFYPKPEDPERAVVRIIGEAR